MKIKYVAPISFVFLYFFYGLYVSFYELNIIPQTLKSENPKGFYDYSGVINVHTSRSSGSGSFDDVIKSAQFVDLDFLIITDQNQYTKDHSLENYYDKLLVLNDDEYSYLDSRLLLLQSEKEIEITGPGQSQAVLSDLLSLSNKDEPDGLVILAHPFKKGYRWAGDYPVGLDGIELMNLKTLWQNAWFHSKGTFLWSLIFFPFNPELSFVRLFSMPEKELNLWNKLSQKHHTIVIAGADAEAKLKFLPLANLNLPSYSTLFNLIRNHVLLESELTGNFISDRSKIRAAIKRGQFYLSIDRVANPKGFNAYIKNKSGNIYALGSKLNFKDDLTLHVKLPAKPLFPTEVIIFKDGAKILTSTSVQTEYTLLEPGIYRVVVRTRPNLPIPDNSKWLPWIFTNNFYIN